MFGRQIRTRLFLRKACKKIKMTNFQGTQRIPGNSELMDKSRFVTSMQLQWFKVKRFLQWLQLFIHIKYLLTPEVNTSNYHGNYQR